MAVDPEHAPLLPFPGQTQARVGRMFDRLPKAEESAVEETGEHRELERWHRDPWLIVTVVLLGAVIGIAVGLWAGPWKP